jgi:hypothetical protein
MQNFKKLIVCGDSYQTPSHTAKYAGTHWSEVFAKRHDLKLITFADWGMSDAVIAFQIQDALSHKDAIIVASPSAGLRLEWCQPDSLNEIPRSHTAFQTPNKKYPNAYMGVLSLSQCRLDEPMEKVFLSNLNPGLEEYKQRCMLFYALMKLQKQKRTFLFLNNIPYKDIPNYELLEVIDQKSLVTKQQFDLKSLFIDRTTATEEEVKQDPGYHTSPVAQITITNYIEQRIKELIE